MRYWYVIFFTLTLFSSTFKDRVQGQLRRLTSSQEPQFSEPESPKQSQDNMRIYIGSFQTHEELAKNQRPEHKKNDLLRVLEIKLLVGRILQDLEK